MKIGAMAGTLAVLLATACGAGKGGNDTRDERTALSGIALSLVSTSVSKDPLTAGDTETATATIGSETDVSGLIVDIRIYDSNDQQISKQTFDPVSISAGGSVTLQFDYASPSTLPAGTYHVSVGAWDTSWTTYLYETQTFFSVVEGTDVGGGTPSSCTYPEWVRYQYYPEGSIVTYQGALYRATHANPGYVPTISTYFWAPYTCAAPTPPPPPTSSPPPPPPPPSSSGLPSKMLATYYTAWDTSYALTDVPMDFSLIYLFNAQNGGTNTGDGSWTWSFDYAVSPAQIQQVRNRGQKVVLTVGGAGLGFSYNDRTQSTNCVSSIEAIISHMGGIDGVDFNNYEAGIGTSPTEMVWIAQQLKANYGADFIITSPPAANNTGGAPVNGIAMGPATDLNVMGAMADAGVLTYAAPQFYDWNFYNEPGVISSITAQWVARLGADKVMIGLSANYANGPSLSDSTREWNASVAANPGLRGAFCWSAQTDLAGGNIWGSTMKSLL